MLVSGFWWWRSDPDVEKGNAKAQDGKFEEALADFERAESSLSTEEQKRQLAFDRGIALHGAGKLDEAQKAFAHAAQSEDKGLRARAAFNEGNTALARKNKKEAIDAFVRSLRADPSYAPARKNLELLLSEPPPPPAGFWEKSCHALPLFSFLLRQISQRIEINFNMFDMHYNSK